MSALDPNNSTSDTTEDSVKRLSYKFQRLRERIRDAIQTGELAGKLPGERILARRFKVNAKTLSKALTELAAEGVLHRNVGLGTFVKGTEPATRNQNVLFLVDPDQVGCPVIKLMSSDPEIKVTVHSDMASVSPAMVSSHGWIVVCSRTLREEVIKDLSVRGHNIILYGRDVSLYSTHSVHYDHVSATIDLARKLKHHGHRKMVLVGSNHVTKIHHEVMQSYNRDFDITYSARHDVHEKIRSGATAAICLCHELAVKVIDDLKKTGFSVPDQVSVVSMGIPLEDTQTTGLYTQPHDVVNAIQHIMRDNNPQRPQRIWLSGNYRIHDTSAAVA